MKLTDIVKMSIENNGKDVIAKHSANFKKNIKYFNDNDLEEAYLDPNPSGEPSLKYLNVKTNYKEKLITIHGVPVYEYETKQIKISRKTRIRLRELLQEAYNDKIDSIDFTE